MTEMPKLRLNENQLLEVFSYSHDPSTIQELLAWRELIRWHRDQRGDDRCWQDNEKLYTALPEGYTPPARDTLVELHNCERYIASCHDPRVTYVSPQRRIEELEAKLAMIKTCVADTLAEMRSELPCRVDEMNEKELGIFNAASTCVGALLFIDRQFKE